jgi:DNA-binding PadR family transcriptional regulator
MSGVRLTDGQSRMLARLANGFQERTRKHTTEADQLVGSGLASYRGSNERTRAVGLHITPAGRAWLERNKEKRDGTTTA